MVGYRVSDPTTFMTTKTTREKDTTFIRAITREGLDSGQMPKKYIPTGNLEMKTTRVYKLKIYQAK